MEMGLRNLINFYDDLRYSLVPNFTLVKLLNIPKGRVYVVRTVPRCSYYY
jgi:hypothetical protein